MSTNTTAAPVIDVCEPTDEAAGSISVRAAQYGPEICYAVGPKHGDWYVVPQPALYAVANIERPSTSISGRMQTVASRKEAEQLVRLFAGLYAAACS